MPRPIRPLPPWALLWRPLWKPLVGALPPPRQSNASAGAEHRSHNKRTRSSTLRPGRLEAPTDLPPPPPETAFLFDLLTHPSPQPPPPPPPPPQSAFVTFSLSALDTALVSYPALFSIALLVTSVTVEHILFCSPYPSFPR
ncbi:hypothetical protein BDZ91DRAFT_250699 [Kalaharituber pfeilii]|nr:hypothetical protein BDZ91DRAFT_250699 [Kalaharituber pfeilii]